MTEWKEHVTQRFLSEQHLEPRDQCFRHDVVELRGRERRGLRSTIRDADARHVMVEAWCDVPSAAIRQDARASRQTPEGSTKKKTLLTRAQEGLRLPCGHAKRPGEMSRDDAASRRCSRRNFFGQFGLLRCQRRVRPSLSLRPLGASKNVKVNNFFF